MSELLLILNDTTILGGILVLTALIALLAYKIGHHNGKNQHAHLGNLLQSAVDILAQPVCKPPQTAIKSSPHGQPFERFYTHQQKPTGTATMPKLYHPPAPAPVSISLITAVEPITVKTDDGGVVVLPPGSPLPAPGDGIIHNLETGTATHIAAAELATYTPA